MVPQTITDFWNAQFQGDVLYCNDAFVVALNPELEEDSRVMMLKAAGGKAMATLTPALADRLGLSRTEGLSETAFRRMLGEAGVTLHGADYVFYFSDADRRALLQEVPMGDVRRLTATDEAAFKAFEAGASAQDLDDAYVELDHWAVFGAFDQGRLVSAASAYPWREDVALADLGVLTLADARGKGHARRVVRSLCRHICDQGYEPQYRCQIDNHASVALAKAAGLTLFGTWEIVSPDSAA